MSLRIALAIAIAICSLFSGSIVHAQGVPRAFLCGNIVGSYSGAATSWKPEEDKSSNQTVLLHFRGSKTISSIKWLRGGKAYYEGDGIGHAMNGGFGIVVFGEEYIETYVLNVGTSELFFSMVRSGSPNLPNSIKSMRGVCTPAGSMAR
jgi:hypothetical protein